MIEIALMIEGQDGLNWDRWRHIARVAEDTGLDGLYRSDHFTNPNPPDTDSLECWTSLTWLASHTSRIEFGPLVSPVSFRDPAMLARVAAHVDDLSGGRLRLGLGAGWQEREHNTWGYSLLPLGARFKRFREGIEVASRLLRGDEPASFEGSFYHLREARILPRPRRPGGPPIVIGGNGQQLTLPLAAQYADEWNATFRTPDQFGALSAALDKLLIERGRRPSDVRRTMMVGLTLGRTEAQVRQRLGGRSAEEARASGRLVGTPHEVRAQLVALESAGVQRVMLQWPDLGDLEGLEALAEARP